jgi:hypothetical protein
MILIAGDSWGCREWGVPENKKHECLAGYFRAQGDSVINISVANACNFDIVKSVDSFLDNNNHLLASINRILVFQSNWNRDWRRRYDFDISTDLQQPSYPTIVAKFIHRFYMMLNQTGSLYNKKIELIGGCADTIAPDECQYYEFLQVSCQSMVNLLTTGSARIVKPVHSLWVDNQITLEFIEHLKKILDSENLNLFLNDIDLGHKRLKLMRTMPKYFGEDWYHANSSGHQVLFEFLTN